MISIDELEFLRESNNIEDEWDDKSLQDAILAWQYIKSCKELSEGCIRTIHSILMSSRTTIAQKYKGKFRQQPVYIGGHEAVHWATIPERITKWLTGVNYDLILEDEVKSEFNIHKERLCQQHHVSYEYIHPFVDGNGRTGRIFYNWERLRLGLPIHTIHVGKEQREYYGWFK